MSGTYHHGVRVTESTDLQDSITDIDSSVIGVICTASDADEDAFPLNKPVLLTRVASYLGKAGTKGTLKTTLTAISNQCSPKTIVIRVPDVDDYTPSSSGEEYTQDSLVIGGVDTEGRYYGAYALLTALSTVGVQPRIIGAPGLDTEAVATQLVVFAQKLRAFVYASAYDCKTVTEAKKYASDFSQREIMIIYPDWTETDTSTGETVTIPAPAVAIGLRALIDQQTGWHKSLSNVAVTGPTGISRDVYWSLQDTDSDADDLNSNHVTTLIKRSGFRFWGSRTCDEETYIFETYTRTAQILADTVAQAHAKYNDAPLTPSLATDIVDGVNRKLSALVTAGQLLGGTCWYDTADNTTDTLKQGQLLIRYDYTPVPPLEDLQFIQTFSDSYFETAFATASSTSTDS
ncbi:phage tail sheath protein [Gibbsiella dentisursi]|uniref:Phage tail sheath protein n=1 Tax=Gibbsiella dentisursi TaxID=796890 RepID=A0ABP7M1K6_9GAMM